MLLFSHSSTSSGAIFFPMKKTFHLGFYCLCQFRFFFSNSSTLRRWTGVCLDCKTFRCWYSPLLVSLFFPRTALEASFWRASFWHCPSLPLETDSFCSRSVSRCF